MEDSILFLVKQLLGDNACNRNRRVKLLLGSLLYSIRQKNTSLKQKQLASDMRISIHTLNNIEKSSVVSIDLILRAFHYYKCSGHLTLAEERLFFYLYNLIYRTI